jgi:hypothetical protein
VVARSAGEGGGRGGGRGRKRAAGGGRGGEGVGERWREGAERRTPHCMRKHTSKVMRFGWRTGLLN